MRFEIGWNERLGVGRCVTQWKTYFETDSEEEAKKELLRARQAHSGAVCVDSKNNYALVEP